MQIIEDIKYFNSPEEWRNWLVMHCETESEIWVGLRKKGGNKGLGYEEALLEALCYGWVDGLTKRVDEESYKIRFTPRRPKSNWAITNVRRVEKLIKKGKMTPLGLKHIDAAKADGRWPL